MLDFRGEMLRYSVTRIVEMARKLRVKTLCEAGGTGGGKRPEDLEMSAAECSLERRRPLDACEPQFHSRIRRRLHRN